MRIYNAIESDHDGVFSIESFPVIEEQLSDKIFAEVSEYFKQSVKKVKPHITHGGDTWTEDDLERFVKDGKFAFETRIIQIVCSYIDC